MVTHVRLRMLMCMTYSVLTCSFALLITHLFRQTLFKVELRTRVEHVLLIRRVFLVPLTNTAELLTKHTRRFLSHTSNPFSNQLITILLLIIMFSLFIIYILITLRLYALAATLILIGFPGHSVHRCLHHAISGLLLYIISILIHHCQL
ncbi:hypothetical protein, unlikely, partial [Trypanosoma congolense IL3000]